MCEMMWAFIVQAMVAIYMDENDDTVGDRILCMRPMRMSVSRIG